MEQFAEAGDDALQKLLEEGSRSYVDAVTAIIEYQSQVQKKCRLVTEGHLDDYSAALNLKDRDRLRIDEIQPHAIPAIDKWEGDQWSLGVRIVRTNIPGVSWWGAYCTLDYNVKYGLFCWVGEWLSPKRCAVTLAQKLRTFQSKIYLDVEGNNVGVSEDVEPSQVAFCENVLEKLMEEWIRLWSKVGGIREIVKT
jgi:hypothetical protein